MVREDLTIAERTRAPDTSLLRVGSFFSQTDKLPGLKKKLAGCKVLHIQGEALKTFDFGTFVNHLSGMNKFTIADVLFIAVRTTNDSYVISKVPCESLYETAQGLMSIELKDRVTLDSGGGSGLYIYLVRAEDVKRMESLSAIVASRKPVAHTLEPDMSSISVNEREFRERLGECQYLKGTREGFDVAEFADSVKFSCKYEDTNGNPYYFIMAGEKEDAYRMYVNRRDHDMEYFSQMHIFRYGNEVCRLYKED